MSLMLTMALSSHELKEYLVSLSAFACHRLCVHMCIIMRERNTASSTTDANGGQRNTNTALTISITVILLIVAITVVAAIIFLIWKQPWKSRKKTITSDSAGKLKYQIIILPILFYSINSRSWSNTRLSCFTTDWCCMHM